MFVLVGAIKIFRHHLEGQKNLDELTKYHE